MVVINCFYVYCTAVHREESVSAKMAHPLLWRVKVSSQHIKILFFVQVQASVALKRIDKFMNSEELKSDVERLDSNSTNGHSGSGQTETTKNAVEIEDATFQWESNQVPFVVYTQQLSLNKFCTYLFGKHARV